MEWDVTNVLHGDERLTTEVGQGDDVERSVI